MGYYFLRSEVRQTHVSLTLPLGIWYFCTIRAVLILLPDISICYFSFFLSLFFFFLTLTQMYHRLRTLARSLHFKYQWIQLLVLEYSKGLVECVQASCMLPFVRVTRLCGDYVNGNFCLFLFEESTLLSGKTEGKRNTMMEIEECGVDIVRISWLFFRLSL